MKIRFVVFFAAVITPLVFIVPTFAHHGNGAYDLSKSITTTAVVTDLDWHNPHCLLRFDAKDEKGEVQNWAIEMYNPLYLTRAGWTRTTLKAGDEITITFHPAKNGTTNGYIRDGDGKVVFDGKELSLTEQ